MSALVRICQEIDMPPAMTERLTAVAPDTRFAERLCDPNGYAQAAEALHAALGNDPEGVKMLATMLFAAERTRQMYRDRNMPPRVFTDTMRCFSRFVREHKESFGVYGFDRWQWTGRQLSRRLFRLGALEYETVVENGENLLSLHIPSDADLSDGAVDGSLAAAAAFSVNTTRPMRARPSCALRGCCHRR